MSEEKHTHVHVLEDGTVIEHSHDHAHGHEAAPARKPLAIPVKAHDAGHVHGPGCKHDH